MTDIVIVDPALVRRYAKLAQQRSAIERELDEVRTELDNILREHFEREVPTFDLTAPWPTARVDGSSLVATYSRTCTYDATMVLPVLQQRQDLAGLAAVAGPKMAKYLWSHPSVEKEVGKHVRYRGNITIRLGRPDTMPKLEEVEDRA